MLRSRRWLLILAANCRASGCTTRRSSLSSSDESCSMSRSAKASADVDVGVVGPVRHPRRDLGRQPTAELLEQRGELVARQHQLELGQLAFAAELLHRRAEHPRQVDRPHHLVQVVALTVLGVVVEPGERVDGLLRQDRDLRLVALLHRLQQRARQLTRRHGAGADRRVSSSVRRRARPPPPAPANTARKARSNSPVGSELLTNVARNPALTDSRSSRGRWVSAVKASITAPVVTSMPRRRR